MSNLRAFQENGVDPSKIATVIIADGMRPFLKTYDYRENVRRFIGPLFRRELIADRFGVSQMFSTDELNEAIINEVV
jgi:hypothetical protein